MVVDLWITLSSYPQTHNIAIVIFLDFIKIEIVAYVMNFHS